MKETKMSEEKAFITAGALVLIVITICATIHQIAALFAPVR